MRRVYLDSCIVIYLIQGSDSVREKLHAALSGGPSGNPPRAYVSALTRLECRVWPLREQATELLAEFDLFFSSRDLRVARLTSAVFELATELRASHGIKTPDALHLAAALHWGCNEFWTNDLRLPSQLNERISIKILP